MVALNVHAEQMAAVPYTLAQPRCEYAAPDREWAIAGFARAWATTVASRSGDLFRLRDCAATFRTRRLADGRWGVFEVRGEQSAKAPVTEHSHDPR